MDIVLLADKGGVGKSTLAWCTAHRLRHLKRDVACVDLDQRSSLLEWSRLADGDDPLRVYTQARMPHIVAADMVWDTPAHASLNLRDALLALGGVCLVVAVPDPISLNAAVEMCGCLLDRGADARVVVNQVHPTSSDGRNAVEWLASQSVPHLPCWVRSYRCYTHAQWDGRVPADGPYPSADAAWSDIVAVTDAVLSLEVNHA